MNGRLGAHPYDIPYLDVVGEDYLLSRIDIDYCTVARLVKTEIIEPRAILAEIVTVIFVLRGGIDIADKKDDSPLPLFPH
jgi:hypothetical protein